LTKFLAELSKHQSVNKMSAANIAIVIGPNLLWAPSCSSGPGDAEQMGRNITWTHLYSSVVDQLVSHVDYFFPEGENIYF